MYDSVSSCTIPELNSSSSHFRVSVLLKGRQRSTRTAAMIDSGATALFISRRFVTKNQVFLHPLHSSIPLFNIDGTHNAAGSITHYARLQLSMGDYVERLEFLVTDLGPEDVVLGLPWLRKVNPDIDWEKGTMELGEEEREATGAEWTPRIERIAANRVQRRKWWKDKVLEDTTEELWCAAGYTYSTELAQKANQDKPKRTFEEIVPEEYRQYSKVFSETESERLPEHKPYDHAIDLKPDAPETLRSKVYPMPPNEQEELDRFLEENLRKGYIVPSKSPMASPVFFVKKKDGKLRLVQDYRKLNDLTVKNRYPLPLASDIISRLRQAKYFTKFDVRWGYHNVRIKEGDEWKAAFVTNQGLFEPRVMLFGLTNSPATFQALMNSIFADLIVAGKVAVYLDDILIFSSTLEEHRQVTHEVLRRLQEHDLYLRPEKCEFERTEVEYLGLIIREGEVAMDPVKVRAVTAWPAPRNLRELRGFLGFANFYRRFIRDFSRHARPLNDLTKKDVPWTWGLAQQRAFQALKDAFTSEPVLISWDPNRPTRVEVDASGFATGGVLLQKLDDGLWHPVAFRSESMSDAERNYEIYDREMLGIIRALEDWRHYLEGLPNPFEIITDHRNLEYWRTAQNLSRRQARWSLYLSRFDFHLTHKPGKSNTQADPLSRLPTHQVLDADDNQEQIVLGPERFATLSATLTDTSSLEQEIRDAQVQDPEVVDALRVLKEKGPRKLTNGLLEWEVENGLIYRHGKLYIPSGGDLRKRITFLCHDTLASGHPGRNGTLELVSRLYWWPQQAAFVRKYVEGCETCQRRKAPRHPRGTLHPHDVPEGLWQTMGVDLITGLPLVNGYDAIIVYCDHYSKQVHVLPTTSNVTAEGVADIHYREIFRLHGIPSKIVSDRGPQFAARFMKALYEKLGIQHALTTAYHPQSNGQTERANQEVEKHLRLFTNARQDDWVDHLPTAEFVLNSRLHSALDMSPFEVIYGYRPDFTVPIGSPSKFPVLEQRLETLREVRREAEAALRMEKETMKEQFEQGKPKPHEFKVGDRVWMDSKDVTIHQASRKLGPRRLGPYVVVERVGDLAYRLQLPHSMLPRHDVIHVDRLTPWTGNEVNGDLPPEPDPVEVEGELEYEVEEILDSRKYRNQFQYLVHWKGYSEGDNSWEPAKNLTHCQELIDAFHKRNPNAPRRISAAILQSLPWQPLTNFTETTPTLYEWESGRLPGRGSVGDRRTIGGG